MSDGADPTEINALAILGADPDVRELASLESLRTMATLAVHARRMTVAQRAKRLRKLESLEVVTLGEIVDAQQKRAGIELDTEPRDNDRWKPCVGCGQPLPVGRGAPRRCEECTCPLCPCGCGKRGPRNSMRPNTVRRRHGKPWRCMGSARTFEGRSAASRKAASTKTPEQRSARTRKGNESKTPEQRSAAVRKANMTRTAEQRSESARKAHATKKVRRAPPTSPTCAPEFEGRSNV